MEVWLWSWRAKTFRYPLWRAGRAGSPCPPMQGGAQAGGKQAWVLEFSVYDATTRPILPKAIPCGRRAGTARPTQRAGEGEAHVGPRNSAIRTHPCPLLARAGSPCSQWGCPRGGRATRTGGTARSESSPYLAGRQNKSFLTRYSTLCSIKPGIPGGGPGSVRAGFAEFDRKDAGTALSDGRDGPRPSRMNPKDKAVCRAQAALSSGRTPAGVWSGRGSPERMASRSSRIHSVRT